MKRFLSIILTAVMLFSLVACGEPDVRGEVSTADQGNQTGEVAETATVTETETAEETSFTPGTATGSTWENKFIGLGCKLPEGWVFYTEDEIKALNNYAAENAGTEYQEMLENATIIYDMQATHTETGSTVAVNLEKHNALSVAVSDLKDVLSAQISSIETAFQNIGYQNIQTSLTTVTVDGTTYDALTLTAEINGVTLYEVLFAKKCGSYIANITVATAITDETASLLDCFYSVN